MNTLKNDKFTIRSAGTGFFTFSYTSQDMKYVSYKAWVEVLTEKGSVISSFGGHSLRQAKLRAKECIKALKND